MKESNRRGLLNALALAPSRRIPFAILEIQKITNFIEANVGFVLADTDSKRIMQLLGGDPDTRLSAYARIEQAKRQNHMYRKYAASHHYGDFAMLFKYIYEHVFTDIVNAHKYLDSHQGCTHGNLPQRISDWMEWHNRGLEVFKLDSQVLKETRPVIKQLSAIVGEARNDRTGSTEKTIHVAERVLEGAKIVRDQLGALMGASENETIHSLSSRLYFGAVGNEIDGALRSCGYASPAIAEMKLGKKVAALVSQLNHFIARANSLATDPSDAKVSAVIVAAEKLTGESRLSEIPDALGRVQGRSQRMTKGIAQILDALNMTHNRGGDSKADAPKPKADVPEAIQMATQAIARVSEHIKRIVPLLGLSDVPGEPPAAAMERIWRALEKGRSDLDQALGQILDANDAPHVHRKDTDPPIAVMRLKEYLGERKARWHDALSTIAQANAEISKITQHNTALLNNAQVITRLVTELRENMKKESAIIAELRAELAKEKEKNAFNRHGLLVPDKDVTTLIKAGLLEQHADSKALRITQKGLDILIWTSDPNNQGPLGVDSFRMLKSTPPAAPLAEPTPPLQGAISALIKDLDIQAPDTQDPHVLLFHLKGHVLEQRKQAQFHRNETQGYISGLQRITGQTGIENASLAIQIRIVAKMVEDLRASHFIAPKGAPSVTPMAKPPVLNDEEFRVLSMGILNTVPMLRAGDIGKRLEKRGFFAAVDDAMAWTLTEAGRAAYFYNNPLECLKDEETIQILTMAAQEPVAMWRHGEKASYLHARGFLAQAKDSAAWTLTEAGKEALKAAQARPVVKTPSKPAVGTETDPAEMMKSCLSVLRSALEEMGDRNVPDTLSGAAEAILVRAQAMKFASVELAEKNQILTLIMPQLVSALTSLGGECDSKSVLAVSGALVMRATVVKALIPEYDATRKVLMQAYPQPPTQPDELPLALHEIAEKVCDGLTERELTLAKTDKALQGIAWLVGLIAQPYKTPDELVEQIRAKLIFKMAPDTVAVDIETKATGQAASPCGKCTTYAHELKGLESALADIKGALQIKATTSAAEYIQSIRIALGAGSVTPLLDVAQNAMHELRSERETVVAAMGSAGTIAKALGMATNEPDLRLLMIRIGERLQMIMVRLRGAYKVLSGEEYSGGLDTLASELYNLTGAMETLPLYDNAAGKVRSIYKVLGVMQEITAALHVENMDQAPARARQLKTEHDQAHDALIAAMGGATDKVIENGDGTAEVVSNGLGDLDLPDLVTIVTKEFAAYRSKYDEAYEAVSKFVDNSKWGRTLTALINQLGADGAQADQRASEAHQQYEHAVEGFKTQTLQWRGELARALRQSGFALTMEKVSTMELPAMIEMVVRRLGELSED